MANYATLKSAIEQVIKTNGNNEITGALLQQSLLAMINTLGAGYQFVGIATPTTNPGTPDYNVFYIASTAGTYSNFPDSNNVPLVVNDGEIAILKYNGTWTKDVTGAATVAQVAQLVQELNDVENLIKTSFTTSMPVTDPDKDNYYIGPTGGLVSHNSYTISQEITLPAKSIICFTAVGVVGNVTVLAKYSHGSGSGTRYVPLVPCDSASAKRYSYTNDSDNPVGVYICSNKSVFANNYSILPLGRFGDIGLLSELATSYKGSLVGAINELVNGNDLLLSFLGTSLVKGNPVVDPDKDGYLIGSTGGLNANANYTISTGISIPARSTIYFSALGAAGNVTVLAQYSHGSGTGTRYKVLVLSDATELKQYSYTNYADSPIEVFICSTKVTFGGQYQIFALSANENPTLFDGGDAGVFHKGICVGDSLTAGTFNYLSGGSTSNYINIPKYSYPTKLAEIMGIEITNKGLSGATSDEWYSQYQNDDLSGFDFAIIQLGVNDYSRYGGWTQTSIDAFNNIINKLQNENTNIKIFVATIIPATSYGGRDSISAGIRSLVTNRADENVILLDMAKYSQIGVSAAYNCGHLSAYGYWRIAKEYFNYMSWYIYNNKTIFREVQFIGTNYQYEE